MNIFITCVMIISFHAIYSSDTLPNESTHQDVQSNIDLTEEMPFLKTELPHARKNAQNEQSDILPDENTHQEQDNIDLTEEMPFLKTELSNARKNAQSEQSDTFPNENTHQEQDNIDLTEEMFFLKAKLSNACRKCSAQEAQAVLSKMRHPLSEYEQSDAFKETVVYCTQESAKNLLQVFNAHGFKRNGKQRDGQTNLLLAAMRAAQTCQLNLLGHMLERGENPDNDNIQGGSHISTIAVFDLLRRKEECPPCTREVFEALKKYSTEPPTPIVIKTEPGIWVQEIQENENPDGSYEGGDSYGGGFFANQRPTENQEAMESPGGDSDKDDLLANQRPTENPNQNEPMRRRTIWRWLREKWNRLFQ